MAGALMKIRVLGKSACAAALVLAACSTTPLTTTLQPTAMDYALKRARFEMNCPSATGSVLSSETIQPPARALMVNQGPERAQYTIGVSGCDQRKTIVVLCAQGGDGCFAANGLQ
jgi:hypothetical protein